METGVSTDSLTYAENVHCEVSFRRIEELENFGVNRVDITKLKSSGFHTLESLAHSTLKRIQDVKGISEQKAIKLKVFISPISSVYIVTFLFSSLSDCYY